MGLTHLESEIRVSIVAIRIADHKSLYGIIAFLERLSCTLHSFAKGYQGYNPISDFALLLNPKSGKFWIKNPFLDSPKGTHPKKLTLFDQIILRFKLEALCIV